MEERLNSLETATKTDLKRLTDEYVPEIKEMLKVLVNDVNESKITHQTHAGTLDSLSAAVHRMDKRIESGFSVAAKSRQEMRSEIQQQGKVDTEIQAKVESLSSTVAEVKKKQSAHLDKYEQDQESQVEHRTKLSILYAGVAIGAGVVATALWKAIAALFVK